MPENKIEEVDILNFALNLEYLEAEFYTYATTGKSITSFGIGTKGTAKRRESSRRWHHEWRRQGQLFQRGVHSSRYGDANRCR